MRVTSARSDIIHLLRRIYVRPYLTPEEASSLIITSFLSRNFLIPALTMTVLQVGKVLKWFIYRVIIQSS